MASATIVSSVSNVPFRRFLPHERQTVRAVTPHNDYHDEDHEDMPIPAGLKPQVALLSSEDVHVLMEDAAQHGQEEFEALENWYNPPVEEDNLYLPFTLASVAN